MQWHINLFFQTQIIITPHPPCCCCFVTSLLFFLSIVFQCCTGEFGFPQKICKVLSYYVFGYLHSVILEKNTLKPFLCWTPAEIFLGGGTVLPSSIFISALSQVMVKRLNDADVDVSEVPLLIKSRTKEASSMAPDGFTKNENQEGMLKYF